MYTLTQIEAKLKLARAAGLSGAELLANRERARRVCNGIGAAWMWACVRWIIGELCPHLVVVADIHDLRYETGGTGIDRWLADWEFLANGFRMAIFTGMYRQVALKALMLWICLRIGGRAAFHYRKEGK